MNLFIIKTEHNFTLDRLYSFNKKKEFVFKLLINFLTSAKSQLPESFVSETLYNARKIFPEKCLNTSREKLNIALD